MAHKKLRRLPPLQAEVSSRFIYPSLGKRRRVWDAKLGRLMAEGFPNAAEALAELQAQILHLAAAPYSIEHRDPTGRPWSLRATPDGWEYRTPSGCWVGLSRDRSEEQALRAMCEHAAQYCEGAA